jgi:predicted NBD/HSP70 family sugar kinase
MCVALGRGLHMIATALAPTEIVIVGDITPLWDSVGPVVEAEMARNPMAKVPRIRPANDGSKARLRSAVALVMHENLL